MPLSWLDITIILIVVACTLISLWRGFVREIISLGAFVLAAILATRYFQWGAKYVSGVIKDERLASIMGFTVIFLGIIGLGFLLGMLVKSFMKSSKLSPLDRLMGGIIGLLKAAVLVSALVMMIDNFVPDGHKTIIDGQVSSYCLPMADILADFLPRSFVDKVFKNIERSLDNLRKYQDKLKESGKKVEEYKPKVEELKPKIEKLMPPVLIEKEKPKKKEKESENSLEKDREKMRNVLRKNL